MRKVYLTGDIDEESFVEFCERLDTLEADSNDPIELELNSIGGNALDAIAFLSRMRLSPCDINVTVFGLAGSAAVLVLAAGDYRRMTKESWVMVHEDSTSLRDATTSELEKQTKIARAMEEQWCSLLQDLTGTKKETWSALHKSGDLYIMPKECVQLGLADEVV